MHKELTCASHFCASSTFDDKLRPSAPLLQAFYHRSSTSHPTRPTVQIGAMCTHVCIFSCICMRHGPLNVFMSDRVMVCHCHAKTKP